MLFQMSTEKKIKYLKTNLVFVLALFSVIQLVLSFFLAFNYPFFPKLSHTQKTGGIVNTPRKNVAIEQSSYSEILTYKVVGYRIGDSYSSVILKKNNKQVVLRIGEVLEGKYKLVDISSQQLKFDYRGQYINLKNTLGEKNVP